MGITQNYLPKNDLKVILVILLKCIFFIIIHFLWDCTMFKKIMVYTFICIAIVTSGTIQCILLNIIDKCYGIFLYIIALLSYKYYPVVLCFIINNNKNCCC